MSVPACSWNKQNLICLPLPFSYHILGALVLQLPLQKVLRWNNFFLNTRKLKYSRFCENFVQDLSPNYLLKQKNRFFCSALEFWWKLCFQLAILKHEENNFRISKFKAKCRSGFLLSSILNQIFPLLTTDFQLYHHSASACKLDPCSKE